MMAWRTDTWNAARPAPSRARSRTGGFTLVETLMALVILVVLTGIVAMGVPVAFETYAKAVDGANAQTLLATATTVLRDELGLSQATAVVDGERYYLTSEGYWARLESTSEGIVKHVYLGAEPGRYEAENSPEPIVSAAAQTDSLRVLYDDPIGYDDGVFTVDNLRVVRPEDDAVLADVGEAAQHRYSVKAIMSEEGR